MNVVLFLTTAIVTIHFIDKWLLSKGQLEKVYKLMIVGCFLNAALNLYLASINEQQRGLLLFLLSSAWTLIMAIKGLRRLKK